MTDSGSGSHSGATDSGGVVRGDAAATSARDQWQRLVAVAMLGTDRRNPPEPAGSIADLLDDTLRERPSDRLLAQVAASVAVRRAGVLPGPAVAPLAGPAPDDRPTIVPAAVERWHHITTSWPVLEDEWMLVVVSTGRRLPAQLVPDVLIRHRRDPARRARAIVACGPLAEWLVDQLPDLAGRPGVVDPEAIGELPELPIPGDLTALLTAEGATIGRTLAARIEGGELAHAHRAVLINLLARIRADALGPVEQALAAIDPTSPGHALASVLADLTATRRRMLDELS